MAPAPRSPSSAARVVYAGIVASTSIIIVGALSTSLALGTATMAVSLPDAAALILGSGAFVAGIHRRNRLTPSASGESGDEWWSENAGRLVLIWGLMELTAVSGAILVFATGHLTAFVALAVMGLAGLTSLSPRRVKEP